jgi:hypothetical protein
MTLSDRLATAVAGPTHHPATNSCLDACLGIGLGGAALALGAGCMAPPITSHRTMPRPILLIIAPSLIIIALWVRLFY